MHTPDFDFKVTPLLFVAEYLINGTRYRYSFNGILIGTYARRTQQCHFEWLWLSLSDLTKYLMARSVPRSLCYSWASRNNSFIVAFSNVRYFYIEERTDTAKFTELYFHSLLSCHDFCKVNYFFDAGISALAKVGAHWALPSYSLRSRNFGL